MRVERHAFRAPFQQRPAAKRERITGRVEDASDDAVILDRFVGHPPLPSCEASLTVDGRVHPGPAVDLQAHDRVVLVWYDLKPGDAQFDFRCGSDQTLNRSIHLTSDKPTTIRTRLKTTTPAFRPASG